MADCTKCEACGYWTCEVTENRRNCLICWGGYIAV